MCVRRCCLEMADGDGCPLRLMMISKTNLSKLIHPLSLSTHYYLWLSGGAARPAAIGWRAPTIIARLSYVFVIQELDDNILILK